MSLLIFMLYVVAIALSLLAGFACGALFYRKNSERLKAAELEGKKLLDTITDK